jgi:serine/threonine protein kinase
MEKFKQDYQKLQKLGEGTYGKVYQARHIQSKEIVAVKKIKIIEGEENGIP